METVNIDALQQLADEGYLTGRPHPTADLIIWNYTLKTTFSRNWTPETMMCRGLITTRSGQVVARPFPKFFEIDQHMSDIPGEPFKVTEKADGSLGIVYMVEGIPYIATRGSFTSSQALRATAILHEKYSTFEFKPYYTYLFEIILPENRIVVNYGTMEDLILLAVIHTATGRESDIHDPILVDSWPFPVVKHYDGITDIAALKQLEEVNQEGFVICFESGLRIKVKFAEYLRIFAIVTRLNAHIIWEHLKSGKGLAEFLVDVPEEFTAWVKSLTKEFSQQYLAIHNKVQQVYKEVMATTEIEIPFPVGTRLSAKQFRHLDSLMKKQIRDRFTDYPDIEYFLFMTYTGTKYHFPDGRFVSGKEAVRLAIWDSIEPKGNIRPFRQEDGEEEITHE